MQSGHRPLRGACNSMAGIPTEASILQSMVGARPARQAHRTSTAHPAGGGKYMAVLQCRKTVHIRRGHVSVRRPCWPSPPSRELKHVIPGRRGRGHAFDSQRRALGHEHPVSRRVPGPRSAIPGVRCHPLDPSSNAGLCLPPFRDHRRQPARPSSTAPCPSS